jgi:hypothetical protein
MGKKKKRFIIVSSSVVLSFCLLYFLGGYLAAIIVCNALFGKRQSNVSQSETFETVLYYDHDDYPSLSNPLMVKFSSGQNQLQGYFYEAKEAKGTFLFAHGLKGYADDETSMVQDAILKRGYSLFSFDLTSSGRSEGEGISSLAQGAHDVRSALDYLFAETEFYCPLGSLYLSGYSWGAYAVAASLNYSYPSPVKGVLCFSGFDTPMGEMVAMAHNYVSYLAEFNSPTLDWGMASRAGEDRYLSASKGIAESGARAYIVQGDEDSTVPLSASLYEAIGESKNVKKVLRKGFDHTRPYLCASSEEESKALRERYQSQSLQGFKDSLSKEERGKANRIDDELMDEAFSFLEGSSKEVF